MLSLSCPRLRGVLRLRPGLPYPPVSDCYSNWMDGEDKRQSIGTNLRWNILCIRNDALLPDHFGVQDNLIASHKLAGLLHSLCVEDALIGKQSDERVAYDTANPLRICDFRRWCIFIGPPCQSSINSCTSSPALLSCIVIYDGEVKVLFKFCRKNNALDFWI